MDTVKAIRRSGFRHARTISSPFPSSRNSTSVLTDREQWWLVGPGAAHLLEQLEALYWEGVASELENIVWTLRAWQGPEGDGVRDTDEGTENIHGFDTFLDNVSKESRDFAARYENERRENEPINSYGQRQGGHRYESASRTAALDQKANYISTKIKVAVRKELKKNPKLDLWEQRALMLLQAAGFLDIDKLIEHRRPIGISKQPAIPQLKISKFDMNSIKRFEPLHCSRSDCRKTICGSMFASGEGKRKHIICEDCYWTHSYGDPSYIKSYRHCILGEVLTPDISVKLCPCYPNTPDTRDRRYHNDEKWGKGQKSSPLCGLIRASDAAAMAKYNGLREATEHRDGLLPRRLRALLDDQASNDGSDGIAGNTTGVVGDADIPLFLRSHAEENPFGHMHMALRVGPLVIENGVPDTKEGVRVTVRDMPTFDEPFRNEHRTSLSLIVDGTDRQVWRSQSSPKAGPKRYKAVIKQVVGVPFAGTLPGDEELEIVRRILAASQKAFGSAGLTRAEEQRIQASILKPILADLQDLLGSRVRAYLSSISQRILDNQTTLTWNALSNNCQSFCNTILDQTLFGPLLNGPKSTSLSDETLGQIPNPLYTMSFLSNDGEYVSRTVRSKFSVPQGHVEEFLNRLRLGRSPDEADLPDSLQEYWYDWGGFGGPLYYHQDIFPWDCTEAYKKNSACCGDQCALTKHIWAFPFDSWSLVAHHLTRDRYLYAPVPFTDHETGRFSTVFKVMDIGEWMRNRLKVITASSILLRGAAAMARVRSLCQATAWLHSTPESDTNIRLGGIHRAQPYSHYFEAGTSSSYFTAPWSFLSRRAQIVEYERLRERRMAAPDIHTASWTPRFFEPNESDPVEPRKDKKKKQKGWDNDNDNSDSYRGFNSPLGTGGPPPLILPVVDMQMHADACFGDNMGQGNIGGARDMGPGCAVACGSACGVGCGSSNPVGAGGACGGGGCGGGGGSGGGGGCGGGCGGGGCGGGCGGG